MTKLLPAHTDGRGGGTSSPVPDLTEFDLSSLKRVQFEFQPKDDRVN